MNGSERESEKLDEFYKLICAPTNQQQFQIPCLKKLGCSPLSRFSGQLKKFISSNAEFATILNTHFMLFFRPIFFTGRYRTRITFRWHCY